jgi:hypothetical protein
MGKLGIISTIKREYKNNQMQTMDSGLNKKGMTRIPGTGVFKFPYREVNGKYRTGLDHEAGYIKRITDQTERELEVERVIALKAKLEQALGDIDLGPRAEFWNYAKSRSTTDQMHVQPVKLLDGDNYYDLDVVFQELTFSWLRVHPTIASSLQSWQRGEFPADTQFYVVDKAKENALLYKKKIIINKAIVKLDDMIPTKRTKVARLLGLPVTNDTPEEFVYNHIDNLLKQTEFTDGKFKGLDPVRIFTTFSDMNDDLLHIKDLVKQAITHSIYRVQASGRVYQGDAEVATSEEELIKYLADNNNQEDLMILEDALKAKQIAAV